jgi:hypothetical protein
LKKDEELRLKNHALASAETVAVAAEQQWHKGLLSREWLALLFAVSSFVIAQILVITLHYRNTKLDHQTEEVKLARDLSGEFYSDQKPYLRIANAIAVQERWPGSSQISACSWSAGRSARR